MREYHINLPYKMLFNEAIYFKDYLLFKTKNIYQYDGERSF